MKLKSEMRSSLLEQIRSISLDDRQERSLRIQSFLKQKLQDRQGVWAGYQALTDERSLDWRQVAPQVTWCFPVVQNLTMEFVRDGQDWGISALGVREPQKGFVVLPEQIQGYVIPAVGFDRQGYRLGRGRGYYDRFLAQCQQIKIGICFASSLCDELPHDEHDLRCDWIITENGLVKTSTQKGDIKWS